MDLRTIILLVASLGTAGGTGFLALDFMNKQRDLASNAQQETVIVKEKASLVALVVTNDLQPGQFIRTEDLEWLPWPEAAAHDRFITLSDEDIDNDELKEDAVESFNGGVVHKSILKGQPIQRGQIVFPGDRGFLAAVLEPGMKAVSVAVSKDSGVSGLVLPGDRVDVLVAMKLKGTDVRGESTTRFVSSTMLENVRVLGIDQTIILEEEEGALKAKTVTIEVDPGQARKVSVARELGRVSLALRSLATEKEKTTAALDEIIPNSDLKKSKLEKASFKQLGASTLTQTSSTQVNDRNYTLDTEIFTINGRDMSMLVGTKSRGGKSKPSNGVVVLRGNQSKEKK